MMIKMHVAVVHDRFFNHKQQQRKIGREKRLRIISKKKP